MADTRQPSRASKTMAATGDTPPAFERIWFKAEGDACRTPAGLVSRREFLGRAQALAATFAGEDKPALLACTSTLNFAVALCALLRAGRDIVLPANLQPETLDDACFEDCVRVDDAVVSHVDPVEPGEPAPFNPAQRITLFTSGSTGEPKRVVKRLRQLSAEAGVLEAQFGSLVEGCEIAATVPHIHIYGMLFRVIWPLASGRVFATETAVDARLPLAASALVSSPAFLGRVDPALLAEAAPQVVFSSGGRMPVARAEALAAAWCAPLLEIYGSTETGGIAWRAWEPSCDGRWTAFAGVRIRVSGAGILDVASAATGSEWIQTGDEVVPERDGRFRLEGRADGVLKIEDKRVSPRALIEHLESHAWIDEARLVQLAGRRRQLGAVLRLAQSGTAQLRAQGKTALVRELKTHAQSRFEAVVVPRRWRFVDAYPLNAMGKTTSADLAALFKDAEDA